MSSSSGSSSSSSTTVKLYFTLPTGKQEIRRFTSSSSSAAPELLPALLAFLSATYERSYTPPLRFNIAYDDGEDLCSVSSEAELQEGLQLHAASGAGGVLKLLCSFDESTPAASSLQSPMSAAMSGMSTPSINVMAANHAEFPIKVESTPAPAVVEPKAVAVEAVPSPAVSGSVEDGELVTDAHESDDEYERINEEESTPAPVAAAAAVVAVEVEKETKAEAPVAVASPRVEEEDAPSQSPVSIEDVTSHPSSTTSSQQNADAVAWLWGEPAAAVVSTPVVVATTVVAAPTTSTSASASSSSFSSPLAVHIGITCDVCGVGPIVGSRFHCLSCTVPGGYDLCEACERSEGHFPLSHQLIEFKTPEEAKAATTAAPAVQQKQPEKEEQKKKAEAASSSSSSASASASASVPAPIVHLGVTCDGCRSSPLTGNRYHCTTCTMPGGFDLCEACEQAGDKHPSSHLMMKMRAATASGAAPLAEQALKHAGVRIPRAAANDRCARPRPWATTPAAERPKAQFISDVTCADGMQVHAGETLRKTWSIKNVGTAAWPKGVRLVFAGGDLAPESEGLSAAGGAGADASGASYGALVPFAGPGDVVHVSIDLVVPNESGRFRGTFRLQTAEGDRFGPRIWIDLSVPEGAAKEEAVAAPVVVAPVVAAAEPVEVKSAPAPAVVVAAPASAPVAVASAPASAPASIVVAESKQREEEAAVASASASASSASSGPVSGAWGRPVRVVSLNNSAAESALAAEFSAAHISPVAPIPVVARRAAPEFQYSNQLAILRSMGFTDKELCKYLLLNNRGDLDKVIQWLLANAAK